MHVQAISAAWFVQKGMQETLSTRAEDMGPAFATVKEAFDAPKGGASKKELDATACLMIEAAFYQSVSK